MAYTGLHYAYGPSDVEEGIPGSAFSKGDLLVYDSSSSLSRAPTSNLSVIDLAGVAMAGSNESFRNRVPFFKAENRTVYFSVLTTGITSAITAGMLAPLLEDADSRPVVVPGGANDPVVVVERPFTEIEQDSGVSRVLVRILSQPAGGGGLEHDA